MSIFAVLLNWNDGDNVIRSVKKLSSFPSIKKIILVDNGSTDGSLQQVEKLKSQKLIIVENKENQGFARGCNLGFKLALALGADAVVNLNPDLDYPADFIGELAKTGSDLAGPVLKFKRSGRTVYDFGGKINPVFGKIRHMENTKPVPPQPGVAADYISGGAAFIKKKVFEKIGFFDERFFMYFEDADFSLRARQAGFTLAVEPEVVIEHKLEVVKITKNWKKIKNNTMANFLFIFKWVPWYFKPAAYAYLLAVVVKIALNAVLS